MRTVHRDIVGGFIFSSDGKILLGQSTKGGAYQDTWVVPGGGIEPGETKLDALKREILEEVAIDISTAHIGRIPGVSTGESEKVLKETGERVLVKMKFFDFKVMMPVLATDVELKLEDDLAIAQWFDVADLGMSVIGEATKATLTKLGFFSSD